MLLSTKPIIIGAVHMPYYGCCAPQKSISQLEEYAITNFRIFSENGIKCVYLQDENLCNKAASPETIAIMSSIGRLIRKEIPDVELGIVVQAHDGISPIAIAHACGASFVRIKVFAGAMLKSEGILQGCGTETMQYRESIHAHQIKILADAHDRTGYPLLNVPITQIASWVEKTGADGIILTGMNHAESMEYIRVCREKTKKPLIIGGGVTMENIKEVLSVADGAVVSTCLMRSEHGNDQFAHWDGEKIKRFMDKVLSNNVCV